MALNRHAVLHPAGCKTRRYSQEHWLDERCGMLWGELSGRLQVLDFMASPAGLNPRLRRERIVPGRKVADRTFWKQQGTLGNSYRTLIEPSPSKDERVSTIVEHHFFHLGDDSGVNRDKGLFRY